MYVSGLFLLKYRRLPSIFHLNKASIARKKDIAMSEVLHRQFGKIYTATEVAASHPFNPVHRVGSSGCEGHK